MMISRTFSFSKAFPFFVTSVFVLFAIIGAFITDDSVQNISILNRMSSPNMTYIFGTDIWSYHKKAYNIEQIVQ